MNGLEVDHQWGQEMVAGMAVDRFVVPELNPNTANAAQAKVGGGERKLKSGWGVSCDNGACDGVLGRAHCRSYRSIETTSVMIFCSESFCYKYTILFSPFHCSIHPHRHQRYLHS
jgi:hypothetical protein